MGSYDDASNICKFIKSKIPETPKVAIICGSGLGTLAEAVTSQLVIRYSDIKEFPKKTGKIVYIFNAIVIGHAGNLVFGYLGGKYVMIMQGRFHPYEGYSMSQVRFYRFSSNI